MAQLVIQYVDILLHMFSHMYAHVFPVVYLGQRFAKRKINDIKTTLTQMHCGNIFPPSTRPLITSLSPSPFAVSLF